MADCVNSSPSLISRKFQGFGAIRKIQGNSIEFSMALSMNAVGIAAGFRGNADFWENLGFGVVSGALGGQIGKTQMGD